MRIQALLLLLPGLVHGLSPVVNIKGLGKVSGVTKDIEGFVVDEFKGIEYASAKRWTAPESIPSWGNLTKKAHEFGKVCPGAGCMDLPESEDCLFLNVYRAASLPSRKQKYPVMFWIHGGGYSSGCSNGYKGDRLVTRAQGNVVVVTINYRLNVFGFLGGNDLRKLSPRNSTGNYGFLDQQKALQWVRDHISDFGGDPDDIMIFGESAGAGSVTAHLINSDSRGMFTKAIAESGLGSDWNSCPLQQAESDYQRLLSVTNCSSDSVACLQKLSTAELSSAIVPWRQPTSAFDILIWGPVEDGVVFTKPFWQSLRDGEHVQSVDILAGTNRDEGAFFEVFKNESMTESVFDELAGQTLNASMVGQLKALYSPGVYRYPDGWEQSGKSVWWWMFMRAFTDKAFTCPHRRSNRWLMETNENLYTYEFIHATQTYTICPGTGPGSLTVPHASDIFYVFNCAKLPEEVDCSFDLEAENDLAHSFGGFWTSFAMTGSPSSEWPRHNVSVDSHFILDIATKYNGTGFHVVENFRRSQCDFWDEILMGR
eukprot:TRINITY_DN22248_c0_g1_i1.p1 TRINITY_DN22248_c0_g1~~TRINITY_DN22248_c0_g1_i1.p1  ORF type:complete len:554 (+),score=94.26 TRINITY_DN22248_c0_g1_i1:45-1664(+)